MYPGSVHDFTIFSDSVEKYNDFLKKNLGDENFRESTERHPSWALLADKGYVGCESLVRAIIPKKAPLGKPLSPQENAQNARISAARIVCENFYGRMKKLFKITADRYRGLLLT